MTAKAGDLVLIKVGDGSAPEEVFTSIGGLRISHMLLNNESFDSSNLESGAWRQLQAGAGIRSISISASGMFADDASEELVRTYAFSNTISNYQFIFGKGDFLTGPFQITSYERNGSIGVEEIYSLAMESAGAVEYSFLVS